MLDLPVAGELYCQKSPHFGQRNVKDERELREFGKLRKSFTAKFEKSAQSALKILGEDVSVIYSTKGYIHGPITDAATIHG